MILGAVSLWKYGAIIVLILGAVGGASTATYQKTKSYYVQEGDSRVLKVTEAKAQVEKEFNEYRTLQADRVRTIELTSAAQAASAASEVQVYREKLSKSNSAYNALLKQRKEVAGKLSTSAVDTLNSEIKP